MEARDKKYILLPANSEHPPDMCVKTLRDEMTDKKRKENVNFLWGMFEEKKARKEFSFSNRFPIKVDRK